MEDNALEIRLIDEEAFDPILPLLGLINPYMSREMLLDSLEAMRRQGYRCAYARYGGQYVGVLGLWIQTKFYVGKHVEYDNFYVKPFYRGRGIGTKMLAFAENYAIAQGCVASELSCDVIEERSREFWEKQQFVTVGYRYRKRLGPIPS